MTVMPEGVKIYFGENLKKKIAVETILKNIFESNSYSLIELPAYEFYKDIEENFSLDMRNKMYKFVDRDSGETVTLRPDMTSLLAKLVKLRKENIVLPERIFYIGDVFRYDEIKSGVYREISQAGVELIGEDSDKADIEILVMAIESLKKLGLKNPKIEIGDISILNSIISKSNLSKEDIVIVKDLILKKDIPTLDKFLKNINYTGILLKLPMMIGDKTILEGLEEYGSEKLKRIVNVLDELGYKDNYIIDLGIVKAMEYYTGIVFNGFCDNSRDFILNGGRYDKLMEISALGFVINVDNIVEIAENIVNDEKNGVYIYGKDYIKAMKMKEKLILEEKRVEISYKDISEEEIKEYATKKLFKYLYNTNTDTKISL